MSSGAPVHWTVWTPGFLRHCCQRRPPCFATQTTTCWWAFFPTFCSNGYHVGRKW